MKRQVVGVHARLVYSHNIGNGLRSKGSQPNRHQLVDRAPGTLAVDDRPAAVLLAIGAAVLTGNENPWADKAE